MKNNTERRERQKGTDIRVIISNPPYSAGQKSQNDNAKNVAYARLDQRIRSTYAERSNASLLQNLYDSYIRAIRWAATGSAGAGVMGFVSGSAWIERSFADGLRKCLGGGVCQPTCLSSSRRHPARTCCLAVWPARARTCSARAA